jgi:serine/threonine-protein kinase
MLGERVGNYVIRQLLGEGGMGQVYLAEHPQIGKRVALKVLHAELASNQEITTRFFHEAKAVNDIAHPNIVDILDFGRAPTSQGEVVYLVMELLTGCTLTSVIEQGPLDPQRTTRIALEVADALAASHGKGIVHRDLKPDNIMLVTRGREESVKLLDFGIAKVTNTGASTKTRTGMVMGTPTYMSPEQCEGRGAVDHRTDIYALGIVLYEMLTGRVPFTGSGYGEILVKQMTEAPTPLSALRPGIPPHLELLVQKALQKRPEERFASMQEMAMALAQPEQYVEARGGLRGFLPSSPIASAAPSAATVVLSATGTTPPHPTTLSQSAGQMAPVTPSMLTAQPATPVRRSKAPLVAMGAVAAAAIAAVIAIVGLRGGAKDDTSTVAAAEAETAEATPPQATPPTTTTPPATTTPSATTTPQATPPAATPPQATPPTATTPQPTTPAAETPVAPPVPATVKLTIGSKPAGASVYVAGEAKPRCETPCDVEAARGDRVETITVKLAGFSDVKRRVRLNADQALDLDLPKKSPPRTTSKAPKKPTSRPIGDNTLNPFDN